MIGGVGTDIVSVKRIASSYDKLGDKFLDEILCLTEKDFCLKHKLPELHIAVRFAAKEAVMKALGVGGLTHWHEIEIGKLVSGEPYVVLGGSMKEIYDAKHGTDIHLSMSHCDDYATAFVVVEVSE